MAEPSTEPSAWASRMQSLRDSAQQRVLTAPMPIPAMDQLLADGKAEAMGPFEGSPIRYMNRWWRQTEQWWVALDETATSQLDQQAERYQAAIATLPRGQGTPDVNTPSAGANSR
ncbi:hypothetical protein OG730_41690 (plasmid) [Streptomyces sp. NBC_01298]|uniref:hypothetical protein n=1 Tax=Streptomyces sp. NBC_01298 TaxID=2903817 RepID=UPI002E10E1A2|nr:hypothetical protein OG730_41690 [Streptomyces sp. NBC_01298]